MNKFFNHYRFLAATLFSLGVTGCAVHIANTPKYFPEAAGTYEFSKEAFASGSYRLGQAGSMAAMGGKMDAYLLLTTGKGNSEYKQGAENVSEAILDVITKRPSGDAVSYFYLGYAAQGMGFNAAAYEYYSLALMLYDYRRQPGVSGSLWTEAVASGNEAIISECGYRFRNWNGWEGGYCIEGLRQKILNGIRETE